MPLTSHCQNCGNPKTMDYYGEHYCKECTDAVNAARKAAREQNVDPGQAKRAVLAERAHTTHRGRANPMNPLTKGDYWGAAAPEEK